MFDTKNIKNRKQRQIEKGIEVESEHKETYDKFIEHVKEYKKWPSFEMFCKWIAKDHLKEIPDYYDRLAKMEDKANKDKVIQDNNNEDFQSDIDENAA